jgi:plasmid stability protein
MRTTLTLDDDVAAKLQAEARKNGRSFKETVNQVLRLGLNARREVPIKPFKVRARPLGARPDLNFDNIEELLDQIEGPMRR